MYRRRALLHRRVTCSSRQSQRCSIATAAKPRHSSNVDLTESSVQSTRAAPTQRNFSQPWPTTETRDKKVTVPSPNLSKWARPSAPEPTPSSSYARTSHVQPTPHSQERRSTPQRVSRRDTEEVPVAVSRARASNARNINPSGVVASERRREPNTSFSSKQLTRDPAPHQSSVAGRTLDRDTSSRSGYRSNSESREADTSFSGTLLHRDPAPHQMRTAGNASNQGTSSSSGQSKSDWSASAASSEPMSEPRLRHHENYVENDTELKDNRAGRLTRGVHKSRGSLVSKILNDEDAAIVGRPRLSDRNGSSTMMKPKKKKPSQYQLKAVAVDLFIPSVVSVGTLARLLNVRLGRLQRKMVEAGMEAEASPDHILTSDFASLLAMEFGRNPVVNDEAAFDLYPAPPHPDPSVLPLRPPVVTIMGHVDHGKTTLLDTLRSSSVAKSEAGGITQHIGAFSVPVGTSRTVTFLDTPGHAAFSAMRARGATVTDIIVLVVAADDGVMPQTKEVIELIKKERENVGVVVAINKVDKPDADAEKARNSLIVEGLQLESVGGDVPCVEVSGLTGQGLEQLVETISFMAEMQELRAEIDGRIHGYVLESNMHKGLGPVATVLVLRGTLTPGTHLISGVSHGKVRIMQSPAGNPVKSATPGTAVIVSGWKELPNAGNEVLSGTEADVKKAVTNRVRKAEVEATLVDLEAINEQRRLERENRETEHLAIEEGIQGEAQPVQKGPKELRLVVKGDVSGSVEAVVGAIQGMGNEEVVVKVVSTGVGAVTESDVMMAKAAEGMLVAFSAPVPRSIEVIAAQNHVPLYSTAIIYSLMDKVKERLIAMLPVVVERQVTGEATVLQLFDIHSTKKIRKIAGCRVSSGTVEKGRKAMVVRSGKVIFEGALDTLRQLKDEVAEVRKGSECGLSLSGFDDFRPGDLVQMYHETEKPGTL